MDFINQFTAFAVSSTVLTACGSCCWSHQSVSYQAKRRTCNVTESKTNKNVVLCQISLFEAQLEHSSLKTNKQAALLHSFILWLVSCQSIFWVTAAGMESGAAAWRLRSPLPLLNKRRVTLSVGLPYIQASWIASCLKKKKKSNQIAFMSGIGVQMLSLFPTLQKVLHKPCINLPSFIINQWS